MVFPASQIWIPISLGGAKFSESFQDLAGVSRFLRVFCVCFACVSRAFSNFGEISEAIPAVSRTRWGAEKSAPLGKNGLAHRRASFGRIRLERDARSVKEPHVLVYNASVYRHLDIRGHFPNASQSGNIYQYLRNSQPALARVVKPVLIENCTFRGTGFGYFGIFSFYALRNT